MKRLIPTNIHSQPRVAGANRRSTVADRRFAVAKAWLAPTRAKHLSRTVRAFTMLEMLVAMAATMIMVLFLNQIFGSMSGAASAGKTNSVLIENSRTIIPQITDPLVGDAANMLGPSEDGVLVIINRLIRGDLNRNGQIDVGTVNVPENDLVGDRDGDGVVAELSAATERDLRLTRDSTTPVQGGLRADQIMWIRRTANEEPLTPANAGSFSDRSPAPYVKVWYGHALRTAIDGESRTVGASIPDLGQLNTPSQFAVDWVLARQALFLDETTNSGPPRAYGAWYNANVTGYGGPGGQNAPTFAGNTANYSLRPGSPPNGATDGPLYMGIASVAACGFRVPHAYPSPTPPPPPPFTTGACIVGTGGNPDQAGTQMMPGRLNTDLASSGAGNYDMTAFEYTYAYQRLRVNPHPPSQIQGTSDSSFESWQAAQMHPFLADHVIEFVVQFAGDYFDEATSTDPAFIGPAGYFAQRGIAAPYVNIAPDVNPDGTTRWYDMTFIPPLNLPTPNTFGVVTSPPEGASGSGDLRPVYYSNPYTAGTPWHVDNAFIFRNGRTGNTAMTIPPNWPHLLRFQYRLIDPQGKLVGSDGRPGKLFEQIIKVNRN